MTDRTRNRTRRKDGTLAANGEIPEDSAEPQDKPWQWKPGKSMNPGGLPKAVKMLRDLIAERTGDGVELIDFAVAVMRGEVADMNVPSAREYAHQWLSDRFYGKPKQSIDVSGHVGVTAEHRAMIDALQLSPHERRERIIELKQRAAIAAASVETPQADRGDADGD